MDNAAAAGRDKSFVLSEACQQAIKKVCFFHHRRKFAI
jgi:hypothetical protein